MSGNTILEARVLKLEQDLCFTQIKIESLIQDIETLGEQVIDLKRNEKLNKSTIEKAQAFFLLESAKEDKI